jgi:MoxR-like ATPase
MADPAPAVPSTPDRFRADYEKTKVEIQKAVVGHANIIDGVLTCLFAGGHCLLEGVPGLGKTLLIRSLSQALHLQFSRIQFTPDLMPADVTGTTIVVETPQKLSPRQRELLREFESESSKDTQPESAGFFTRVRDFFAGGE